MVLLRILLMVVIVLAFGPMVAAEDCQETVIIDSVEYPVGDIWCGKKLDSTQLADPNRLVIIPNEFAFEDFHIYVDKDARDAFVKMAESAKKAEIKLIVDSGYRSARYQERVIVARMAEGQTFSEVVRYVAPPGYSYHETGRTLDFVPSDPSFARTDIYRWLVDNAKDFGFQQAITNDTTDAAMPWEPWHWTYVPQRDQ